LEQLATLTYHQLHIVTGMVKDKDVDAVLKMLPNNAKYYFTQSHIPRALASQELALKAAAVGLTGACYEDVNSALLQAKQNSQTNDLILVIGSVYLVAEVNRKLFN
jgi:dihydrofolate synthase/folylpolyglutamate synthase